MKNTSKKQPWSGNRIKCHECNQWIKRGDMCYVSTTEINEFRGDDIVKIVCVKNCGSENEESTNGT